MSSVDRLGSGDAANWESFELRLFQIADTKSVESIAMAVSKLAKESHLTKNHEKALEVIQSLNAKSLSLKRGPLFNKDLQVLIIFALEHHKDIPVERMQGFLEELVGKITPALLNENRVDSLKIFENILEDIYKINPKIIEEPSYQKAVDMLSLKFASWANREKLGYLTIENGRLSLTPDLMKAKHSSSEVAAYLEEQSMNLPHALLETLKMRYKLEQSDYKIMSSPRIGKILEDQAKTKGFEAAIDLLDVMQQEKIQSKKRYAAVADWPVIKETEFLQIIPKVSSPVGMPQPISKIEGSPSILLTMMEPELEETFEVNGLKLTNAEILIMSSVEVSEWAKKMPASEQARLLKHKSFVDNFYQNKICFPYEVCGKKFLITPPTTRYFPKQFLAMSLTGREDVLISKDKRRRGAQEFTEIELQGSKTISSFSTETISLEKAQEIVQEVRRSVSPGSIIPNQPEIVGVHGLISQMPPMSMVGQNAIDSSTDAKYQHLQCVTDVPTKLIPAFQAETELKYETTYEDEKKTTQSIQVFKVRSETFPGSVYKISCSGNDKVTQEYLSNIAEKFSESENNGSLFNFVAHKKEDGSFEYYFVLRKSITAHPHLQQEAIELGTTRPGWLEVLGVRIGKSEETFTDLPDAEYKKLLNRFAVEMKEEALFESIAHSQLTKAGPVRHNLLETSLRALRSDAETSQMFHVVLLKGAKRADDAKALIVNAPQDMKPNFSLTEEEVQKKSIEEIAIAFANEIDDRIQTGKNFGVIIIDAVAFGKCKEIEYLKEHQETLINEFKRITEGDPKKTFKEFLLEQFQANPEMGNFISLFDDHVVNEFLEKPFLVEEIPFHKAIMKVTGEKLAKGKLANMRFADYAYAHTTLIDKKASSEEYLRVKEEMKLLGGTRFNLLPSHDVESDVTILLLKTKIFALLKKGEIEEVSQLLDEQMTPSSSSAVDKIIDQLINWSKEASKLGLDFSILAPGTREKIKESLLKKVASRMIPLLQKQGESYSLQDFSLTTMVIPPEFQSGGKIVPCAFKSFTSPIGTHCAETKTVDLPLVPVGKRIAIIMNGGQAPGVADLVVGAMMAAGPGNQIDVIIHGNEGLIKGESVHVQMKDLPVIQAQGGFPGGTTRKSLRTEKEKALAIRNLQKYDGAIFIGGDGSFRHNKALFLESKVPVYFCIKTIDGDFAVEDADFTLGFYTAIAGYGNMIEEFKSVAKENQEFHFVQVGGRFAGYLAAGTSAVLPETSRPNLSIIPEEIVSNGWNIDALTDHIAKACAKRITIGKDFGVISIAEGVIDVIPEIKLLVEKLKQLEKDDPSTNVVELKVKLKRLIAEEANLLTIVQALSDEDIGFLAKPDPMGRVQVAQIDTYAFLGRLVEKKLKAWQLTPPEGIELSSAKIPKMKGTKSNYDQRSKIAIGRDAENGFKQGLAAVSAALKGLTVDGQKAAIIATSRLREKPIVISTEVKPEGEYISLDHPFLQLRKERALGDLYS